MSTLPAVTPAVVPTTVPPVPEGEASLVRKDRHSRGVRGSCRNRFGRGSRGGGGRKSRDGRGYQRIERTPYFLGDMTDMNGCVFQCRNETTDPKQCSVALEKLSHYVSKNFNSTADLNPILIFSRFKTPVVPKPVKPEDSSDVVESEFLTRI